MRPLPKAEFPAPASASATKRSFVVQPDGTSVEVPPDTDLEALGLPYYNWFLRFDWSFCDDYEMCLWMDSHHTGPGLQMGGSLAPCSGFRFENTLVQDNVGSIWTRIAGPVTIWDRYSDGSYRYHKYGLLNRGYNHATEFSHIMDAWAYDPNNNCTRLTLYQVLP